MMKTYYIIYHSNHSMYTREDTLIFDGAYASRADAEKRLKELWHENPETNYHITEYPFKVMTNADRIRSMTDEELAYIFAGQCSCCAYQTQIDDCTVDGCQKGVLEWLKRKYEEEE